MQALVSHPSDTLSPSRQGNLGESGRVIALEEIAEPTPPAMGWVVMRPLLSGISLSDLHTLATPPRALLAAFEGADDTHVPGHEVVAVVTHSTRGRHHLAEGSRVVIHSPLSCFHKGLGPCARCRVGEIHLCENRDRAGPICSGHALGASPTTGGGWGEVIVAHEDMVVAVDNIPEQRAVLMEACAAAIHSASRWTEKLGRAAILGTSADAALIAAAVGRLHPGSDISVLAPRDKSLSLADISPASNFFSVLGVRALHVGTHSNLLDIVASDIAARRILVPDDPLPVLDGGLDCVVDTMATTESVDLAIRMVRAGGCLVIHGIPTVETFPWPLVAAREISVHCTGTSGGARQRRSAIHTAKEWLADDTFPVDGVVTHRFALSDHSQALSTAREDTLLPRRVVFQMAAAPLRAQSAMIDAVDDDKPLVFDAARRVHADL